jgi:putative flippase GtrA
MKKHIESIKNKSITTLRERSFRRYLVVGISTVCIDVALLALLREKFKGGLFSAVSIAYWASILYNFTLNRIWSFEAQKGMIPKQMIQYGVLLFVNYLVTVLLVTCLESLGMSEYLGKIVALGITVSWTYFIYKKIVFKNS